MADHTSPSRVTRDQEKAEASREHVADRAATDEEAAIADRNKLDSSVSEHEQEMAQRGANQQGEGRIP